MESNDRAKRMKGAFDELAREGGPHHELALCRCFIAVSRTHRGMFR
jgi:hypothetical protein